MTKNLLSLLTLSLFSFSFNLLNGQVGQEWIRTYNGPANENDRAYAIAVDASGNAFVTGYSMGLGTGSDYGTIKYNSTGEEQWIARYNGLGNGNDYAYGLALDHEKNVYVIGKSFGNYTAYDITTVKYDSLGTERWSATYNGLANSDDAGQAIAVDINGNVFITGWSSETGYDFITIKYNSLGIEQWHAIYNGPGSGDDQAWSIAIDTDSNVYVTGSSTGNGTDLDYATVKYNAIGEEQWVVRYNGPGNGIDWPYSLAPDANANIYVTGISLGSNTGVDCATIKYSSSGVEKWVARYNDSLNNTDKAYAIAIDAKANVYITGYDQGDYATIKYDSNGTQKWIARYNGPGNNWDEAIDLALDEQGNVYVTGRSNGTRTTDDYATVKYDSCGAEQWVARYASPGQVMDEGLAIALDTAGNILVTGYVTNIGTLTDFGTIKYTQVPLNNLTINVTPVNPPITIPPSGGFFDFNVAIANNDSVALNFDVWTIARTPNGFWTNPIFGPYNLTLPAGASLTRVRTQYVPAFAPTGNYTYEARLGLYPNQIWALDNFEFTKLPGGKDFLFNDFQQLKSSWNNYGENFDY